MDTSRYCLTAKRLKECRAAQGETLEQLGKLLGVNKTTVMRWEHGDTAKINWPTIQALARHYHVSPEWLLGKTENAVFSASPPSTTAVDQVMSIPILGAVRLNANGKIEETVIGYEPVPADQWDDGEDLYWLRVTGDSMEPILLENDLVLVRRQSNVDSGRFAVVLVDSEEAVIQKLYRTTSGIELHSINPYYPIRRFLSTQLHRLVIIGEVKESKRKFL